MKELIDFIAKEILFCFDGYKTESDNGFFVDLFHVILWGLPLLINFFGGVMLFVAIVITAKRGIEFSYPWFLYIVASFLLGFFLKKIRVRFFYNKDN